ncbi:MAG: hypothetical protein M3220_09570, partial [Chloroflexota bacterium]|nr:hypothetical protein [Chloroflexota bacterium]
VHGWGLGGPTGVLDLAKLPIDWTQPDFDDRLWPTTHIVHLVRRRGLSAPSRGTGHPSGCFWPSR